MAELGNYEPEDLYGACVWRRRDTDKTEQAAYVQSIADDGMNITGISLALFTYPVKEGGERDTSVKPAEETISFAVVPPVTLEAMENAAKQAAGSEGQGVVYCEPCHGRGYVLKHLFLGLYWGSVCEPCSGTGKRPR